MVVYSSSPVQQVVGFFEILGIDQDSPKRLWNRYAHEGGIEKTAYDRYFARTEDGVAIRVGRVHVFKRPFPLGELDPEMSVPQSYAYLSQQAFAKLRHRRLMPD